MEYNQNIVLYPNTKKYVLSQPKEYVQYMSFVDLLAKRINSVGGWRDRYPRPTQRFQNKPLGVDVAGDRSRLGTCDAFLGGLQRVLQ